MAYNIVTLGASTLFKPGVKVDVFDPAYKAPGAMSRAWSTVTGTFSQMQKMAMNNKLGGQDEGR